MIVSLKKTTIMLHPRTRDRLRMLGRKGESFDRIVNRLLRVAEAELAAVEEAYLRIDGTPRGRYVNIDDL